MYFFLEYRSAIFTTSEAQAETAKLVTEEVQAKHFTPKGEFFPSSWIVSPFLSGTSSSL